MTVINDSQNLRKQRKLMIDSINLSSNLITKGNFELHVRFQDGKTFHELKYLVANRFGGPVSNKIIKEQIKSKYVSTDLVDSFVLGLFNRI